MPTATASPTPLPTPPRCRRRSLVPAPLTGRLGHPGGRRPAPDRGHDRRPQRRPGRSRGCRRRRSSGRPRPRAASRATWRSSRSTLPKNIGPVRSSRYYYIAWAAEWRAVYAHAGGSPQAKATLAAKGNGQYVYNVDEFRYSGTFLRITTRSAAAQPVHDRARSCARPASTLGAKDKAYKPVWKFAPDAPLEARPYGGTITVSYPYNTITLRLRPDHQHLPPLGDRREEADRRGDGDADRAQERRRHADALRAAERRPSRQHRARGRRRRQRARPGSRPTAGRSRAPGRRPR